MIRCKEALLKTKVHFKKLACKELTNSEDPEKLPDVKERLQKMELLAKKLKVQLIMCASGVIFSVALYFLIWYNAKCWALPFQESPCMQSRVLPLMATNQSTLAEAVDEFILALRPQTTQFHDAILMKDQAERQKLFNSAKTKISQLMHLHSMDLVAFGALKREHHRLGEVELAISGTYVLIFVVSFITPVFIIFIAEIVKECKLSEISKNEVLSAEESENLQNVRIKQLKKQIPVLYAVTLICIAAGVTLYSVIFAGHYYAGSSPVLLGSMGRCDCDYLNFSNTLEATLNKRFAKLDNAMKSPLPEVRQAIWAYESEALETAIEHHLCLKEYTVDRRTMSQRLAQGKSLTFYLVFLFFEILCLVMYVSTFVMWASAEGSVWRIFKFVRICIPVA
ncbi:hypothetical protein Ddc_10187 [Ditylenchus destructor]|nr:hypothetical protein Ddc_10183 [Ditylenchus destructor]KAI1716814.1 hypothetical protein Ddc_10187 [Ditylenchus destructor]